MSPIKVATFRKKWLAMAILAPAMALTACGGSSSGGSKSEGTTVSGLAYDGYLRTAAVCIDINQNKACDADEPSAQTGEGGVFSLTGLTAAQALYPLALQATAGTTIDEDTGAPVTTDFTYLAPAGTRTVSAFSTLILVKAERHLAAGDSSAAAIAKAKAELSADLGIQGEGIDLTNFDPIALVEANASTGDLAARMHMVNRVVTALLADSAKQASSLSDDTTATISAAAKNVAEKLSTIVNLVNTEIGGLAAIDADADAVVAAVKAAPAAQPDAVDAGDIAAAKKDADAAREAMIEEIKEKTGEVPTGATGGTGGSSGGGQGVE